MPAPEYRPPGSTSARLRRRSMTEIEPSWPVISRPTCAARSGSRNALLPQARRFGRSRVPRSMSRNGVGTCWLTTRIISSGVTPLAASEATKETAEVPTQTSNWLTVRLTESRSSARSAPISYTAPVKPPPPRTSAVLERRRRRRGTFPLGAPLPFGESGTTLSINPSLFRNSGGARVSTSCDAATRSHARPAAGAVCAPRAGLGPRPRVVARQTNARDTPRGRHDGRLRRGSRDRAGPVRRPCRRRATSGVRGEALHDLDRPAAAGPRLRLPDAGPGDGRARPAGRHRRRPVAARRGRPDAEHRADRGPRRASERRGRDPGQRGYRRRRHGLRPAAGLVPHRRALRPRTGRRARRARGGARVAARPPPAHARADRRARPRRRA